MKAGKRIITVGLCPCWDTVLQVEGITWGQHRRVDSEKTLPAGKALNISRALAWMGCKNTAAGLWGSEDYEQMLRCMGPLRQWVYTAMTPAKGQTRRNVTIVDTFANREMHLRTKSRLASKSALRRLSADLKAVVDRDSLCVFAGGLPEGGLGGDFVRVVRSCRRRNARIAVDSSGGGLKEAVDSGLLWLIKPNVEELRELLGERIRNDPASLSRAGRRLLDRMGVVLISRGEKGAVAVTKQGAWQGRCSASGEVLSTVGCGDYLLAGFLKGLRDTSDARSALKMGVQAATARAWGWTETRSWSAVRRKIRVDVEEV